MSKVYEGKPTRGPSWQGRAQGLYHPRYEHEACGVGLVVDVEGRKSNQIVRNGIQVLENLAHRGACGCEENTGDGAGILMQIPDGFLRNVTSAIGIELPAPEEYGVGMVFLPRALDEAAHCQRLFERAVALLKLDVLGWRDVPVNATGLGRSAVASQPLVRQVFVGRGAGVADTAAFERKLCLVRRAAEKLVRAADIVERELFYVVSLSARTVVYKGMLKAAQLDSYFPDLADLSVVSALALVHSRFSTNTFPSWSRAHPYRLVAHNGEINTLRGNINWMSARESLLASPLFGEDIKHIRPVVDETGSDSAMFDNVLEMLVIGGRSLPHAMMMMIPEPWHKHKHMSPEKRAFYEFHACMMEPWDGPAAVAFSDGVQIGCVLDRNGLRPLRYTATKSGMVVMASETGVLDIPPSEVAFKGRIQPGRMFLVDTAEKRLIADEEIKERIAGAFPYQKWLDEQRVHLFELPAGENEPPLAPAALEVAQRIFGYTAEDIRLLQPMAEFGGEATGSMGTDTPLAVLSDRPQSLSSYFKQLFAQVTNPPVDAIREELIMASGTTIGPERNLFDPQPESAHQIDLPGPVLWNGETEQLRGLDGRAQSRGFLSCTLPTLFRAAGGEPALREALDKLCDKAAEGVREGCGVVILSDRGHNRELAPIPALLACSAVHHHLLREATRTQTCLVVESGEPREVHDFCLLIGFGASAVDPYLAIETVDDLVRQGIVKAKPEKARRNYISAVVKGLVKVISKMGITTVQSYHGAQVFEAIGLYKDVIDRYFAGTASRVGGVGLDVLAEEARRRHGKGYPSRPVTRPGLDPGGEYRFRSDGENHLFSPEAIAKLQYAVRSGDYGSFTRFSALINDQSRSLNTLRGLMELKSTRPPLPIDEVEPVEAIVRRFKTGAMSYGSISKEAHETLAVAMNRLGGRSNTGEGGEDPERWKPMENGDSKRSAIKQVASGRFGVTSDYLTNASEIQIKMAQGAKPGEGGQLPGKKVYPWIAKTRHSTPGVGLISPPPHHDIYSIEDLAQLIHDLKCANDQARISVKLVAEVGVGTVAAGVAKAKADVILISGHDGGTGASPLTSIKHAGGPWELGLAETHQVLLLNDLRGRVTLETDGQLKTGRDVVIATLLGAEEFGFASAPLVALGCIMMRVCHLNTCPAGIATQDPELRRRFAGKPEHVVNFMRFVATEVRELLAQLGFRTLREAVGHTECLEMRPVVDHWKAKGVDLSAILHQPEVAEPVGRHCAMAQQHGLEDELDDKKLIPICRPALDEKRPVRATLAIRNVNRTVGTRLGSEITRRYGPAGLPEDTIQVHFKGSAGQSFMAFVPKGVTFTLEGDANDYLGKGLSGGKLVVFPPAEATFVVEQNVIIGNVALYGATGGEAYIRGLAGERFCVRNSGAHAVVEGVGDHGCEYMTGGRVVVLGPTGRNFAAGMSGGIAYVLDENRELRRNCNTEMVATGPLDDPAEIELVLGMLRRHRALTGSNRARNVLVSWSLFRPLFVRVIPHDYRRVLEARNRMLAAGMSREEAEMAAFELNARDAARLFGK
ncbi:MAG: glutamate synthase large subunit [Deltaproteobacteria bacterium]|nr:glutamate synthase large subunit [Deltaproteobacteria bacterium]